jgi:hypothetical protein
VGERGLRRTGAFHWRTNLKALLEIVLVSFLASCASNEPASTASSGACSSNRERLAIGEILSLAIGCKEVFPDLQAQVDETMRPLRAAHAGCFAQYERPGDDREVLRLAAALGNEELKRDKTQFCVIDLRDAVDKAAATLGK